MKDAKRGRRKVKVPLSLQLFDSSQKEGKTREKRRNGREAKGKEKRSRERKADQNPRSCGNSF